MAKEISKAQREAVARYEAKAYDKTLIRLPKGKLDEVREAAEKEGKSLNNYISLAIEAALTGLPSDSILTPKAIEKAKEAAALEGEELGEFLARAIRDTAERDEKIRPLLKPQKTQEPPKKEEMPAFNGDFYARHQEYLNRAKEGSK